MRYLVNGIMFHHIPRTGGTTIEAALDATGIRSSRWGWTCRDGRVKTARSHSLLGHYVRQRAFTVRRSFTFVRHPVSYYEAVHRFLSNSPTREYYVRSWHPLFHAVRLFDSEFEAWCESMIQDQGNWVTRLFEAFAGPQGGEFVDFVGRQETLQADLEAVFRLFELPSLKMPKERLYQVGTARHITDSVRKMIEKEEQVGIGRWYKDETRCFGWLSGEASR